LQRKSFLQKKIHFDESKTKKRTNNYIESFLFSTIESIQMKKTFAIISSLLFFASFLKGAPKKDIVDTAIEAGNFKTLVTAVQKAGLVETLKGDGPFTVFAPTDEAFKRFWPETLKNLLKPENKENLQLLLTYHVVSGKVKAKKAMKLESAVPLSGGYLKLSVKDNVLHVNHAKVVKADIKTSNGIIHVIDAVLVPNVSKKSATNGFRDSGQTVGKVIQRGSPILCVRQTWPKGHSLLVLR
jgi:uncharacterized surface protein with fasciclin (FAS1) repeats